MTMPIKKILHHIAKERTLLSGVRFSCQEVSMMRLGGREGAESKSAGCVFRCCRVFFFGKCWLQPIAWNSPFLISGLFSKLATGLRIRKEQREWERRLLLVTHGPRENPGVTSCGQRVCHPAEQSASHRAGIGRQLPRAQLR